MKFTLNKDLFLEKLQTSSRFTSLRLSSTTSLQGVYIKKEKEKLHFYSTNLNLYYHGVLKTEKEQEGAFLVEPKKIIEFLTFLQPKPITLEVGEKNLVISQEKTKGEFPLFSLADYPLLPKTNLTKQKIPTKIFKENLPLVLFSASNDTTRPVLTGVNIVNQNGASDLVATDGFRLSLLSLKEKLPFSSMIVPVDFFNEVVGFFQEKKEVEFSYSEKEKLLGFYFDDEEVFSRVIEGEYPPYEKVIPQEKKTTVSLLREDFLRNVKLVSVFARDLSNIVIVDVLDDGVNIYPKTEKKELNQTFQEAKVEGEKMKVAFNYKFLVDFLSHLKDKNIVIELLRPDAPVVFKSQERDNFLHIIMPVRIQE